MVAMIRNCVVLLLTVMVIVVNFGCKSTEKGFPRYSDYFCYEVEEPSYPQSFIANVYTLNNPSISAVCDSMIKFSKYCAFCENNNFWFYMGIRCSLDSIPEYEICGYIWPLRSSNRDDFLKINSLGVFYYNNVPFFLDTNMVNKFLFTKTDSIAYFEKDTSSHSTIYAFKAGRYALSQYVSFRFKAMGTQCVYISSFKACMPKSRGE